MNALTPPPAAAPTPPMFRPEALRALQEPAVPDGLARIVRPSAWLALLAAALVAAAALLWSVLGHVSTYVQAQGIVGPAASSSGLTSIVATETGILRTVDATVGAEVRKGERVATIQMPQVSQTAEAARHAIQQIEDERAREAAYWDGFIAQETAGLDAQQRDLEAQARDTAGTIRSRQQILGGEMDLLPRGLTTRPKISAARDGVLEAQANLARIGTSLAQIASKRLDLQGQRRTALFHLDQQLLDARERLAASQRQLTEDGVLLATESGTVVMREAALNSVVQAGTRILLIQAKAPVSEGLFFAEPRQGKRIAAGMPVNVSPSTVEAARYGTVLGRVTWVSAVPQTAQAMLHQLGNDQLARTLSGNQAPIAFGVALDSDRSTPSGLRWSSSKGPPFAVDANTLSSADVVVQRDAPATLVIPALRDFLGVRL